MLLFASSNQAAYAVARALKKAGIQAGVGRERAGSFPVSIVAENRAAEVMEIAKAIDPAIESS
jgi:hypothetical protein